MKYQSNGMFEYFDGTQYEYTISERDSDGYLNEDLFVKCKCLPFILYIKENFDEGAVEYMTFDYPFSLLETGWVEKENVDVRGISDEDVQQCLLEQTFSYRALRDWFASSTFTLDD